MAMMVKTCLQCGWDLPCREHFPERIDAPVRTILLEFAAERTVKAQLAALLRIPLPSWPTETGAQVRVSAHEDGRNPLPRSQQLESSQLPLSDEQLAAIEADLSEAASWRLEGHVDLYEPIERRVLNTVAGLIAEIRRLRRDADWVKAAVTANRDVCSSCSAEIARAVGWGDDG